jgi:starch-binding outer membrane protein, SusD/RagB family
MNLKMKNKFKNLYWTLALVIACVSCNILDVEKVDDLNNASVDSVLSNASRVQIEQLGAGVQFAFRDAYYTFSWIAGSVGRECIIFNSTDSRYYSELLGSSTINPAGIFYGWYNSFCATRLRAEVFMSSANATINLSAEEKSACVGYGKTVQAYAMLNCLNMMPDVGIRTDVKNLLNPGPFVSYAEGLTYCKQLADDGAAALDKGGAAFPFALASGYTGFKTPADFKKFNRAVAARIAMFQKDWAGMNTALAASFLSTSGSLATGPQFNYSQTSGDIANGFFLSYTSTVPVCMQRLFVSEAEAGDKRVFGTNVRDGGVAKIRARASIGLGGIPPSTFEFQPVASNIVSMSIIRNEELLLMSAEAKIQTGDLTGGTSALDTIRVRNGLPLLATAKPTTVGNKDKLIDEVLNQRRYSLVLEGGHRWFDMRRYGRLASLPKDLANHNVFNSFPKPQAEVDWDNRPK